jgi:hypothetical protein
LEYLLSFDFNSIMSLLNFITSVMNRGNHRVQQNTAAKQTNNRHTTSTKNKMRKIIEGQFQLKLLVQISSMFDSFNI